ncbi:MAG: hypothetical protein IJU76_11205 [Desulfovibrionaceae bacterium]|nr:hypothetical protein [Desulfovibrionaceae bacterium]
MEISEWIQKYGNVQCLMRSVNTEALHDMNKKLVASDTKGVHTKDGRAFRARFDKNAEELIEQIKNRSYRPSFVRPILIPSKGCETRMTYPRPPYKDILVRRVMATLLNDVYQPLFLSCAFGYWPQNRYHDCVYCIKCALKECESGLWLVEGHINDLLHTMNLDTLLDRIFSVIKDRHFLLYVRRFVSAGTLEYENMLPPRLRNEKKEFFFPILSNIYLHYALDSWFMHTLLPRAQGFVRPVRYKDAFLVICEKEEEAKHILPSLRKHLAKFSLAVDKKITRVFRVGPATETYAENTDPFEFMGTTFTTKHRYRKKTAESRA